MAARRQVGWREVLLVATVVVALVLAGQVVSLLVPPVGDALGVLPLLIVALVVVTALVLLRARGQRR